MSFSSSDDDSQQRFALGFLFALIALVVSIVVGAVVYKRGIAHAPQIPATAVVDASGAAVAQDVASVVIQDGVVKFFFASGKAELAADANAALAGVVKGIEEGKTAQVSGYHDATGDAAVNAALSKQRALAVLEALKGLGVAEEMVVLKKPEVTQATGTNAQARRVEVILLP